MGAKKRKLTDMLTPEEKKLYEKVLEDIAENEDFYTNSTAEEITRHLIEECGFDKEAIYKLFKKITEINEG
ncbi:MAG TPA: hypothetical protein GXX53_06815 [Tissierellia bacterium]|nr:hypothetical protein [Tissierellia bacterium]